ncbi:MAG: hypothetical protein K9M80_06660 [Candidatus Marinimicrobia bacterium]|nr:hypothetical protein [Candidatus Neomarinimicrobiota bacterium]
MNKIIKILMLTLILIFLQNCYTQFHAPRTESEKIHEEERMLEGQDSEYQNYIFDSPNVHHHWYGNYHNSFYNNPYYWDYPLYSRYPYFGRRRSHYSLSFSFGNWYSPYYSYYDPFYDPFYYSFRDPYFHSYGFGSYYSYGYHGYYGYGYPDYYYNSGVIKKKHQQARPTNGKIAGRTQDKNKRASRQNSPRSNYEDNSFTSNQSQGWEAYGRGSSSGNNNSQQKEKNNANLELNPPQLPTERQAKVKSFGDNNLVPQKDPMVNSQPRIRDRSKIVKKIDNDNSKSQKLEPVRSTPRTNSNRYKSNYKRNSSSQSRSSSYNNHPAYHSSSSSSSSSSSFRSSSSRSHSTPSRSINRSRSSSRSHSSRSSSRRSSSSKRSNSSSRRKK